MGREKEAVSVVPSLHRVQISFNVTPDPHFICVCAGAFRRFDRRKSPPSFAVDMSRRPYRNCGNPSCSRGRLQGTIKRHFLLNFAHTNVSSLDGADRKRSCKYGNRVTIGSPQTFTVKKKPFAPSRRERQKIEYGLHRRRDDEADIQAFRHRPDLFHGDERTSGLICRWGNDSKSIAHSHRKPALSDKRIRYDLFRAGPILEVSTANYALFDYSKNHRP